MSEIRDTKESPGDVLVSREDLLRAANGTVGKLQAISGFLHGEDERLDRTGTHRDRRPESRLGSRNGLRQHCHDRARL